MDERKRQKLLLRKAKKRRAGLAEKLVHRRTSSLSPRQVMDMAVQFPVHEALVPHNLFSLGIGNVILSRRLPNRRIAVSFFLVDVSCLGVKDAFYAVCSMSEYDERRVRLNRQSRMESRSPAYVRKLVEESIAYAGRLGIEPHRDYHEASRIFGDIDPVECSDPFEFGKDGKPYYVAGPHDSPTKSQRIIELLTARLGPEGFHLLAPVSPADVELLE